MTSQPPAGQSAGPGFQLLGPLYGVRSISTGTSYVIGSREEIEQELASSTSGEITERLVEVFQNASELRSAATDLAAHPDAAPVVALLRKVANELP